MEENKHEGYSFQLISKYRSVLMGVAILCVVLCHMSRSAEVHDVPASVLARILVALTTGVDIFMLMSGFGLYYSFSRKEPEYFPYMKRRLARLLPSYVIIGGVALIIIDLFMSKLGFLRLLEDFFFVSMFTRGSTRYWFIFAILVNYACFPLVYACVKKDHRHPFLLFLFFMAVFWIITAVLHRIMPHYESLDLAFERIPVFVLGACIGKFSVQDKKLSLPLIWSAMVIGFGVAGAYLAVRPFKVFVRSIHYGYYFTRGLFALAIIAFVILAMEFIEKHLPKVHDVLSSILSYLGGITLEVYLFHLSFWSLLHQPYRFWSYMAGLVVLPIFAAAVYNAVKKKLLSMKKTNSSEQKPISSEQ